MAELTLVFLAGFLAAGVDGALGMGFGPTSSAVLLGSGLPPVTVSATVNIVKIGSGLAGGVAHWRFGNVDRRLALRLALPGVVGAGVGVVALTRLDPGSLRPALAVLLLGVGVRVVATFARPRAATSPPPGPSRRWSVEAVGAAGGCTNGLIGAWGPVVTPYLVRRGVPVHVAVGSVNTAEIAVAVVAVGSLVATGTGPVDPAATAALLAGGVLAAPVAAWTVRRIPPRAAGLGLGTLLLLTQVRELATAAGAGSLRWVAYAAVIACVAVIARPRRPRPGPAPAPDPEAAR